MKSRDIAILFGAIIILGFIIAIIGDSRPGLYQLGTSIVTFTTPIGTFLYINKLLKEKKEAEK